MRLVRYTRELRELLVSLDPRVIALQPPTLRDVFDREVDAIAMERQTGRAH